MSELIEVMLFSMLVMLLLMLVMLEEKLLSELSTSEDQELNAEFRTKLLDAEASSLLETELLKA